MSNSKIDKPSKAELDQPFDRDEWIARAVAAAAMTPGKSKPAVSPENKKVRKD